MGDDWIHNEFLLHCVGIDDESCVGVEVGLITKDDLDLVKRCLKQLDNAQ